MVMALSQSVSWVNRGNENKWSEIQVHKYRFSWTNQIDCFVNFMVSSRQVSL